METDCYDEDKQEHLIDLMFEEFGYEFSLNSTSQTADLSDEKGNELTSGCLEDVWDRCLLICCENHVEVNFET